MIAQVFPEIFPWLITHTWREDGHRQVITSPLEGYEEYEAIQFVLCSGLPDDQHGHGPRKKTLCLSNFIHIK